MIVLAAGMVFLFSFALPPGSGRAPVPDPVAGGVAVRDISGVLLWIAIMFAAAIGAGRSAEDDAGIESLVLSPVDPASIFVGKVLANMAFLAALQLALIPAFVLLLSVPASAFLGPWLAVLVLADIGIACAAVLFGTSAAQARSRGLIMPLLMLPMLLPLILAASRLTSATLLAGNFAGEGRWFILMLAYDVIFITVGAVTFEFVLAD